MAIGVKPSKTAACIQYSLKMETEVSNIISIEHDVIWGHLCVEHDGSITWDQLQAIKNDAWGSESLAIELYPSQTGTVNSGNWRHLWRLGKFFESTNDIDLPNLLEDRDQLIKALGSTEPLDDHHRLIGVNVNSDELTRKERNLLMRFNHLEMIDVTEEGIVVINEDYHDVSCD